METISDQQKRELNEIMGAENNNKTVMGSAILHYLETQSEDQRLGLLQYVLQNFGYVPPSHQTLDNEGLSDMAWDILVRSDVAEALRKTLKQVAEEGKKTTAKQVATKFWELICQQSNSQEKVFLLTQIIYSRLMPMVFPADTPGAVTMIDEEFDKQKQLMDEMWEEIIEIKRTGFDSWTDMASVILHRVKSVQGEKDRAMIMVPVIAAIEPELSRSAEKFSVTDSMDDDEFYELFKMLEPEIEHVKKLLDTPFMHQKTQYGGAVLDYILNLEQEKAQVVVLSQVLLEVARKSGPSIGMIEISPEGIRMAGDPPSPDLLKKLLLLSFLKKMQGGEGGLDDFEPDPAKCAQCDETDCPAHPQNQQNQDASA